MRSRGKLVCRLRGHDNVFVINETFGPLIFCRRCYPKVFSIIRWNVVIEPDGTLLANRLATHARP